MKKLFVLCVLAISFAAPSYAQLLNDIQGQQKQAIPVFKSYWEQLIEKQLEEKNKQAQIEARAKLFSTSEVTDIKLAVKKTAVTLTSSKGYAKERALLAIAADYDGPFITLISSSESDLLKNDKNPFVEFHTGKKVALKDIAIENNPFESPREAVFVIALDHNKLLELGCIKDFNNIAPYIIHLRPIPEFPMDIEGTIYIGNNVFKNAVLDYKQETGKDGEATYYSYLNKTLTTPTVMWEPVFVNDNGFLYCTGFSFPTHGKTSSVKPAVSLHYDWYGLPANSDNFAPRVYDLPYD